MGIDIGSMVTDTADIIGDNLSQYNTVKANISLAEDEFKRNKEMWNLQNAYNDPSAQMQRLRAAGLNPNLVYGTGNVAGNNAGTPPKYIRPQVETHWNSLSDKYVQFKNMTRLNIENDLLKETVNNKKIQNMNDAIKTSILSTQSAASDLKLGIDKQLRELTIGSAQQSYLNKSQMYANLKAINANYYNKNELLKKQIDYLNGQISLQQLDIFLKDKGLTTRDNLFIRLLLMNSRNNTGGLQLNPAGNTPMENYYNSFLKK